MRRIISRKPRSLQEVWDIVQRNPSGLAGIEALYRWGFVTENDRENLRAALIAEKKIQRSVHNG